jgi:hypothetical protein
VSFRFQLELNLISFYRVIKIVAKQKEKMIFFYILVIHLNFLYVFQNFRVIFLIKKLFAYISAILKY